MSYEAGIRKALVVLSPDLVRPDNPLESALLKRAVGIAKATGCELELFHVCYDGGLQYQLFTTQADLDRRQEEITDQAATRVAEIAARLKEEAVDVRYEVRWDTPRSDAILRKIAQASPDIVIKHARERSFVLGITSNTDWELARRSPANLWLVNDATTDIRRLVAAVGNEPYDADDITTSTDHEIFRVSVQVGGIFDAEVHPVNAYRVPVAQFAIAGAAGPVAPVPETEELQRAQAEVVQQHSKRVKSFAKYFQVPTGNVHISEGDPARVIPEMASAIDADLIVLGANSIGRLERIINPVTVEPVIADAACDVLIVRERDVESVPDAAESPRYGVPKYDLVRAITAPESTFDSPQEVAMQSDLSVDIRKRILEAWEYDIRAEMSEENEGGRVGDVNADALDEILAAKSLLEMRAAKTSEADRTLNGTSA